MISEILAAKPSELRTNKGRRSENLNIVDFIASKAVEIETVPFERSTENTKLESIVYRDSEYQNTLHYCQWAGCKLPFKKLCLLQNHERQVHSGMYRKQNRFRIFLPIYHPRNYP